MKKLTVMTILACLSTAGVSFGANFIVNGDFETGNTGFTSEYDYVSTTGPTALWSEAAYAVGFDPRDYHYLWTSYKDHTTGAGKMLIVNGAEFVTPGSEPTVWGQTGIPVVAGIDYRFTYYIRSSYPQAPATLQCIINGSVLGTATAPDLPEDGWLEVSYDWNSGSATTADIRLIDLNTEHTGNDFTIDDISLVNTEPIGDDSATGSGERILSKGNWFMYNVYPEGPYPIQAGNPKDGANIIGSYTVVDNGDGTYTATYAIDPTIVIDGITYNIVVTAEHLAISDSPNFTAKPGRDDNADFGFPFADADGNFYIFAHFEVEYW